MTRAEHTVRLTALLASKAGQPNATFYLHTIEALLSEVDRLRGLRRGSWLATVEKRRAAGICIGCGNGKTDKFWHCRKCRMARAEEARARKEQVA